MKASERAVRMAMVAMLLLAAFVPGCGGDGEHGDEPTQNFFTCLFFALFGIP